MGETITQFTPKSIPFSPSNGGQVQTLPFEDSVELLDTQLERRITNKNKRFSQLQVETSGIGQPRYPPKEKISAKTMNGIDSTSSEHQKRLSESTNEYLVKEEPSNNSSTQIKQGPMKVRDYPPPLKQAKDRAKRDSRTIEEAAREVEESSYEIGSERYDSENENLRPQATFSRGDGQAKSSKEIFMSAFQIDAP